MRFFIFLLLLVTEFLFAQHRQRFYFDFNKSTFNSSQLKNIQKWIAENPNAEILKIDGFCDWVGNDNYNDNLAEKRIATFLQIAIGKVFISENLKKKAFGKKFEQNETQDLNRRVDVYYVIKEKEEEIIENQILKDVRLSYLDSIVQQSNIGDKIKLKNLYFYNNSGVFVPKSKPVLIELLQVMRDNPNLKIEIHGHICCQRVRPNEQISKIRAMAVYEHLQNNGISQSRMSYKSFGSSQPIYKIPEKNEEERNANRRVEILILEK